MFERIDLAITTTLHKYGYDVARSAEGRYSFFKESASGTIRIEKKSDEIGEMSFIYRNKFKDQKTSKDEFIRYKGTNALEDICGEKFALNYIEPRQFSVKSLWVVSLSETAPVEIPAIVSKCLSVAEQCFAVLNSEVYYSNDASRALLEVDLKNKVKSPKGWKNSGKLPAAFAAASKK